MPGVLPDPTRKPVSLDRIPPAPREASPRARRLIFGYHGAQLVFLIVGGVFLAVGSILTTVFCWHLPGDIAISMSRRTTQGIVREAAIDPHLRINRRLATRIRVDEKILPTRQIIRVP